MKKNKCFKNIFLLSLISSILISSSISVYASHEHNSNCYPGTKHTCKGDEINGGDCFMKPIYHQHNNDCYSLECNGKNVNNTYTASETNEICLVCNQPLGVVTIACPDCSIENTSFGCHNRNCTEYVSEPTLQHTYMTLEKAIEQKNYLCDKSETTVDKWENSCGKKNNSWYNTNNIEVTPSCSFIVTNIKAIYNEQKLTNVESGIDMTIEVEYLDGHKDLKVADFNDFSKSFGSATSKTVNLYWTGIGDAYGNQKQFSCKLNCLAPTSTPTPTPIPTVTPTVTPTPTKELTPTMEIQTEIITPIIKEEVSNEDSYNNGISVEIDKELILGTDNESAKDEDETTPTIIELEETAAEKANRIKKAVVLVIIIIIVIFAFISLNIYLAKKELEEELEEEDDDELEDDDYYN